MKLSDKVASAFSETFLYCIAPLNGFVWVTSIVVTLAFLFGYSAHAIIRVVIGPGRCVLFDGFAVLLMGLVFGLTVFGLRAVFQPETIGVDVHLTFNVFCMAEH